MCFRGPLGCKICKLDKEAYLSMLPLLRLLHLRQGLQEVGRALPWEKSLNRKKQEFRQGRKEGVTNISSAKGSISAFLVDFEILYHTGVEGRSRFLVRPHTETLFSNKSFGKNLSVDC